MRRFAGVVSAVAILGLAAWFSLSGRWPYRRITEVRPLPPTPRLAAFVDTLRPGEALGDLFGRHGIGLADLDRVVELLGVDPRRTRAGWVVQFERGTADSTVSIVRVRTAPDEEIRLSRDSADWSAERLPIRWDTRAVRLEGTVATSLYDAMNAATSAAPLSPDDRVKVAWALADVFAWQVDFSREIQPGDRFAVLVRLAESERGERRVDQILASELEVGDRQYSAFRFARPDGTEEFFDHDGVSLRRAFLKAPVEFRRVASRFSRSRLHPVLQIWRKHEGVDYAASAGTPVLAAADGVVTQAGRAGGYGNLIELRHRNDLSTRYAHLRGFAAGIRNGTRVSQGQTIGYVGSTGLVTSAHLHYEFRQNGVARNPATMDLGSGDPIPAALLDAFRLARDRLVTMLRPAGPLPDVADQVE